MALGQWLSSLDPAAANVLWESLVDMVVKTVLVAQPYLYQSYRLCRLGKTAAAASGSAAGARKSHQSSVCFEILGFDVVIDRTLRPFLLEVRGLGKMRTADQWICGSYNG